MSAQIPSELAGVRSILETPIMDDHKWSKVPGIRADMMLVDLEDSVPAPVKEQARERLVRVLRDPEQVGDKLVLARPNHLDSRWGRDDIAAIAEAGARYVAYPKIATVDDLLEAIEMLAENGCRPTIFAIIESAGSMLDLREIARVPQVGGLMFGSGDLSAEMAVPLLDSSGALNPVFHPMKVQAVLAGVSRGLVVTDTIYGPDIRDLEEFRRRATASRDMGFTAFATFYPPHVDVINDVLSPGATELADARDIIGEYERLIDAGKPAALDQSGRTVLIHDYVRAQNVVARAR